RCSASPARPSSPTHWASTAATSPRSLPSCATAGWRSAAPTRSTARATRCGPAPPPPARRATPQARAPTPRRTPPAPPRPRAARAALRPAAPARRRRRAVPHGRGRRLRGVSLRGALARATYTWYTYSVYERPTRPPRTPQRGPEVRLAAAERVRVADRRGVA